MRVAEATAADLAEWAALRAALWPEMAVEDHRRETEALLKTADSAAYIARDNDAAPIGFAEATLRRDHVNGCETSPVAFLEGLYVAPSHRRRGVARALLQQVEAWGRARGVTELASDAEADNAMGLAMHAGLGFVETERVVFFRKPLEPQGGPGARWNDVASR